VLAKSAGLALQGSWDALSDSVLMLDWLKAWRCAGEVSLAHQERAQRDYLAQEISVRSPGRITDRDAGSAAIQGTGLNLVIAATSTGIRPIWLTRSTICGRGQRFPDAPLTLLHAADVEHISSQATSLKMPLVGAGARRPLNLEVSRQREAGVPSTF